jgi:sec-independent protein translocase protein TatA
MRANRLRSGFWRLCELRRGFAERATECRYAGELISHSQVWKDLQISCRDVHNWTINQSGKFMGALSVWHIVIVAAIILLLFGGQGKISDLMGDVGRGIKAFRTALAQPENNPPPLHTVVSETPHDTIETKIAQDNAADIRRAGAQIIR